MHHFQCIRVRFAKTVLISIIIISLCLIPSSEISKLDVQFTSMDIIAHAIMFFAFSSILYLDFTGTLKHRLKRYKLILIVIGVSFLFGILTELMQYLIVILNRTGSIYDLLFDLLGSVAGATLASFIKQKHAPAS